MKKKNMKSEKMKWYNMKQFNTNILIVIITITMALICCIIAFIPYGDKRMKAFQDVINEVQSYELTTTVNTTTSLTAKKIQTVYWDSENIKLKTIVVTPNMVGEEEPYTTSIEEEKVSIGDFNRFTLSLELLSGEIIISENVLKASVPVGKTAQVFGIESARGANLTVTLSSDKKALENATVTYISKNGNNVQLVFRPI